MSEPSRIPRSPTLKPLTRLELSIAEVLRQAAPESPYMTLENDFWMDLIEDFAEMLDGPGFDKDMFYIRCFGENPADYKEIKSRHPADLLDSAPPEEHIGI
jgi:hypothetical protein